MNQSIPNDQPRTQKEKLAEKELRKLAHERVWGSTGQQFGQVESILLDAAKPKVPEVAGGEPDEKTGMAASIGGVEQQDIPRGVIDEATDLLATSEGDEAAERSKIAAERNRRLMKDTD